MKKTGRSGKIDYLFERNVDMCKYYGSGLPTTYNNIPIVESFNNNMNYISIQKEYNINGERLDRPDKHPVPMLYTVCRLGQSATSGKDDCGGTGVMNGTKCYCGGCAVRYQHEMYDKNNTDRLLDPLYVWIAHTTYAYDPYDVMAHGLDQIDILMDNFLFDEKGPLHHNNLCRGYRLYGKNEGTCGMSGTSGTAGVERH